MAISVEEAIACVDKCVALGEPMRLDFYNDDPQYDVVWRALRAHVKATGYWRDWEFWSDGINYSSQDWIQARPKRPDNPKRSGTCWMTRVWDFSNDA